MGVEGSEAAHVEPTPPGSHADSPAASAAPELKLDKRAKRLLVVKRLRTSEVSCLAAVLVAWLRTEWGVDVLVEETALGDYELWGVSDLSVWKPGSDAVDRETGKPLVDLVVSLGGDGTMLWVSNMFASVVPPVVGISMGSLSYLNPFTANELVDVLSHLLEGNVFRVQLRSRLHVVIHTVRDSTRDATRDSPRDDNESKHYDRNTEEKTVGEKMAGETQKIFSSHCVNEAVLDRAPEMASCTPYMSEKQILRDVPPNNSMASIDLYVNDRFVANVVADGLIVATPTGSTAYSMSAGGSMVHPDVPALLFTPICPHSLSMRPLILPENALITLKVPQDSRGNFWLTLDGRKGHLVQQGHAVDISLSPYPFPCKKNRTHTDVTNAHIHTFAHQHMNLIRVHIICALQWYVNQ